MKKTALIIAALAIVAAMPGSARADRMLWTPQAGSPQYGASGPTDYEANLHTWTSGTDMGPSTDLYSSGFQPYAAGAGFAHVIFDPDVKLIGSDHLIFLGAPGPQDGQRYSNISWGTSSSVIRGLAGVNDGSDGSGWTSPPWTSLLYGHEWLNDNDLRTPDDEVPEPCTLSLLGGGFLLVGALVFRRERWAQTTNRHIA